MTADSEPAAGRAFDLQRFNRVVGARLRSRRDALGLSQAALAEALGTTIRQVQRYETGSIRLPASKLWLAAVTLEVAIGYFFDGF